jgi:EAL domain-containing protein (putative c-di-GMP-specific phosphodiesterase class I)
MHWRLGDGRGRRQLAVWRKDFEREFFMSVNMSARQLRDELVDLIRAALEMHSLPGSASNST